MMNQNLEKKNHYNILYSYYQDLLTEKQKEVFENYYFEELFDNYIQTSGTDKEKLNIEINTRLLDLFGFTDEERRFILLF